MPIHRKRTRGVLIALAALALAPLLLLAHPRARAALRIAPGFVPLGADPRVWHEPGANGLAHRLAAALPGAVAQVERTHGLPFAAPFRVYVCSTHESFSRHVAVPARSPVRGMALFRDVWISPKSFDFEGSDTHRQTLAHELSHLHLTQHLGIWDSVRHVPAWFSEGLADYVADTGFERASRPATLAALASGPRLAPDAAGRFLAPRRADDYGLTWPLFHGQSRMFVEYLVEKDEDSFKRFVVKLLHGSPFARTFAGHFHADLETAWRDFLRTLPSPAEEGGGKEGVG